MLLLINMTGCVQPCITNLPLGSLYVSGSSNTIIRNSLTISISYENTAMNENLELVLDDTIQGLGKLADFFGFSPVMGHLYGALLMSPDPLSLDELEEVVKKSKASVSMNMRSLERWNMVREVWVKGDRRKYYEAEGDFWKIIRSVIESRERREVSLALEVLRDSAQKLEGTMPNLTEEDEQLANHYLGRVQDMQAFFQFAQIALESILARSGPPDMEAIALADSSDANHQ